MSATRDYIEERLMRHGAGESWIKHNLTLDDLLALRAILHAEIDERLADFSKRATGAAP